MKSGAEKYGNDADLTEVERLQARVASLTGCRDKLVECNEIARELGFDHTIDALHALRGMMRGGGRA